MADIVGWMLKHLTDISYVCLSFQISINIQITEQMNERLTCLTIGLFINLYNNRYSGTEKMSIKSFYICL